MTRLVPSAWGSTARLFGMALALYFRSARLAACVSVVVMVVNGAVPIATAWFTAMLIDGLAAQSAADVRAGVVGLASIGIAIALVTHASGYVEQEISRRTSLLTHLELFAAVSAPAGLAELEDSGYHDRLRLARDASQFAPAQLVAALLAVGSSAITVGGFAAVLFSWSPVIGTLVMASAVPTLVAQIHLARRRGEMLVRSSPFWRRQMFYAALLLDLRAAKEIRLFGLAGFLQGRMLDEMRSGQDQERRQDRLALRVDSLLSLATGLVAAGALAVFAAQVYSGQGTAGDMVILIAALAATQSTLTSVVGQVASIGEVLVTFRHYVDITEVIRHPAATTGTAASPLRSGIELRDVWFRYAPDHDWILSGLDLSLPHGRSLALVGDNGAGKSTIVKLLCGFYEPTRGSVLWDGVDLRELDPVSLRQRITATFQDFMTYELSAAENILLGDLSALGVQHRVEAAAREVGIHESLESLPQGYDTLLTRTFSDAPANGEPVVGVVLSGGQWQRMALARAVLREDTDLLILDEPSAGLDVYAEHEIHRHLAELRRGRTSVLVSHRLNTVRDADVIAVLAGGRVVEQGSHAELMGISGRYAEMFRLQAAGYVDAVDDVDDVDDVNAVVP